MADPWTNRAPCNAARKRRRSRRRSRLLHTTLAVVGLTLTAGCGSSTSALDRASDEVKSVVADVDTANPPPSYRFTYTAISPLFMACMSGVEDIDGIVDAQSNIFALTTRQRPGDVYSLDGELVIHRDLLDLDEDDRGSYARVRVDATTDPAERNRIDTALGTSLAALIAGGAWPNHPTDTVRALIAVASSITAIEPDPPSQYGIRIILDAAAYTDEIEGAVGPEIDLAPIIDVHVSVDGTISRLVARLPDADDPTTLRQNSDGYAMDYDYDRPITTSPPSPGDTFDIAPEELPSEPTPIPCELEQ